MNKFFIGALTAAVGGFIAFLLVDRFTTARTGGVFTKLQDSIRLPEGSQTVFNATQEETTLQ